MKNILKKAAVFAFSATLAILTLSSCATEKAEVSDFLSFRDNPATAYLTPGYQKNVFTEDYVNYGKTIELHAAKNELESCTISVYTTYSELKGITVELGELPAGVTSEFFIEDTVDILGTEWPDPIVPIEIFDSVNVESEKPKNILVRFDVSKEAVAGEYNIPVKVTDKDGKLNSNMEISLKIWDFEYSDTPALKTAFGAAWAGSIGSEKYKQYYDFLLDYKVSAMHLPFDILTEEANEYLSDPRITSFCIYVSDIYTSERPNAERLAALREKLTSDPEWMKKAMYYAVDEPWNQERFDRLVTHASLADEYFPELPVITPYERIMKVTNEIDTLQALEQYTDIYCTVTELYDFNEGIENDEYYETALNGRTYQDLIEEARANGKEIWAYTCCIPWYSSDFCNLFINQEGIMHRELFWQLYLYDMEGFLFWASCCYSAVNGDPWHNVQLNEVKHVLLPECVGDGYFLYPGELSGYEGLTGPCASIRLETIRDGVEDFNLLKMAEEVLGRDEVVKLISKATTSFTEFNRDTANFDEVRAEIGNAVEVALNNK